MRYANTVVKYYPNYVNVACFNRIVFDDIYPRQVRDTYDKSDDPITRSDSVSRAKQRIFDISMLNSFSYFVTFTFNDSIVSGYDFNETIKRVKTWCKNAVQRYGLVYLLIPELHPTSGRIHLHGFLRFDKKPVFSNSGLKDNVGRSIYNLPAWSYGFSTCIKLDDNVDFVSRYVLKYVTKDIGKITGNFYYAGGKGLQREPERLFLNLNYDDFSGEEHEIFRDGKYVGLKVKYSMLPVSETAYLGFERIGDL